jgi:hypothetical protein
MDGISDAFINFFFCSGKPMIKRGSIDPLPAVREIIDDGRASGSDIFDIVLDFFYGRSVVLDELKGFTVGLDIFCRVSEAF